MADFSATDPLYNQTAQKVDAYGAPAEGIMKALGLIYSPITGSEQSGGVLNEDQANQTYGQQNGLLQLLQGQANGAPTAANATLTQGIQGAQNAAQALGQSQAQQNGVGNLTAMRGILNGQANATQQGAGQAATLNAQQQQAAMASSNELANQMRGQSLQQAQGAQQAGFGAQAINNQLGQNASTNFRNLLGGIPAAIAALSSGGKVPGKPKFGGDDPRNDNVPAMLSGGEVVLPLSVTKAPDAPDRAADFMRAIQARHGEVQHFDSGGAVPRSQIPSTPNQNEQFFSLTGPSQVDPNVANGAYLDTSQLAPDRVQQQSSLDPLIMAAQGMGPSVVPQAMTNATDANIKQAMAANAGARGNQSNLGSILQQASQAQSGIAGKAAAARAQELQQAQQQAAGGVNALRGQDIGQAIADQRARLAFTGMNAGLGIAQQQALLGTLGSLGQAGATAATMYGGSNSNSNTPNLDATDSLANNPYGGVGSDTSSGGGMNPDDLNSYPGAWRGGEIGGNETNDMPDRTMEFAKAVDAQRRKRKAA